MKNDEQVCYGVPLGDVKNDGHVCNLASLGQQFDGHVCNLASLGQKFEEECKLASFESVWGVNESVWDVNESVLGFAVNELKEKIVSEDISSCELGLKLEQGRVSERGIYIAQTSVSFGDCDESWERDSGMNLGKRNLDENSASAEVLV